MTFDSSVYDTGVNLNASGTLALVHGLLSAGKDVAAALPSAKKALKRLRASAETLQLGYQAPSKPKSESAKRAADNEIDRGFKALERRLSACFELDGADGEDARRIHEQLFPNGLVFLKLKYREQWAKGDAVIAQMSSEGVAERLSELVGPKFVALVRERQKAYGEVLGITKAMDAETEDVMLGEHLRVTRLDLLKYARTIATAVDNEEIDEAVALKALRPLDEARAAARSGRKRASGGASEEPSGDDSPLSGEPLPAVD